MSASVLPGQVLLAWDGIFLRQLRSARAPSLPRAPRLHLTFRRFESDHAQRSRMPRIAQPSIWKDILPVSWRRRSATKDGKKIKNPANYFIWIYILIGSQAIRILNVRTEAGQQQRLADIKLRQLRQVIEKLENGEDVDVEKALGTGDEASEQEWEEALRELESEERLWQNNRSRRRAQKHIDAMDDVDATPAPDDEPVDNDLRSVTTPRPAAPAFY